MTNDADSDSMTTEAIEVDSPGSDGATELVEVAIDIAPASEPGAAGSAVEDVVADVAEDVAEQATVVAASPRAKSTRAGTTEKVRKPKAAARAGADSADTSKPVPKAKPGKIVDPGTTKRSRGVTITGTGVGLFVAFLVTVLAVAGFGLVFKAWQDDRAELAAFDDSQAAAANFLNEYFAAVGGANVSAEALNSQVVPLTTGPLRQGMINDVEGTQSFLQTTGIGQLTATIVSTMVESLSAEEAIVVVAVSLSGSATLAPGGASVSSLVQLSLKNVDGKWLVESVSPVGGVSGTGTPEGATQGQSTGDPAEQPAEQPAP